MNEQNEKFDLWCMIELFGHSRIAGKCTEQNIAGANMLRVDVPETNSQPAFTRFLSSGAIYAINPITEDIASKIAENLNVSPVTVWEARQMLEKSVKQLQSGSKQEDEEF